MESMTVEIFFILSMILFGIGLFGFLVRTSLIMMFISAEIMLMAVNINLAALSIHYADAYWQVIIAFTIAISACEAAIGLILFINIFRLKGSASSSLLNTLR